MKPSTSSAPPPQAVTSASVANVDAMMREGLKKLDGMAISIEAMTVRGLLVQDAAGRNPLWRAGRT